MTFTYDGDGNRVAKTVGGVTTQFLVDTVNPTGHAQVMDELTNGTVSRTYTYGLDLISQRLTTNDQGQFFYGYDGHGSVRLLTDGSGAVTDTYDYDAFGNLINQTGSTPNHYLFAGEQYDWDLGLYYNRARYLDVRVGRFWGRDTWEGDPQSPGSLHKYLYVGQNPISGADPSGNFTLVETDISSAIQETLNTLSGIDKIVRIKNQISSVFDVLAAVMDLGMLFATEGTGGLITLARQIESSAIDKLEKKIVDMPMMLFTSIYHNAGKIAETNFKSLTKVAKISAAFSAPNASIIVNLPGFVGDQAPISTPLQVAGRTLKIGARSGGALLGMSFSGGTVSEVQLFHVDPIVPWISKISRGHVGPTGNDLDAWVDEPWLNYQVPRD